MTCTSMSHRWTRSWSIFSDDGQIRIENEDWHRPVAPGTTRRHLRRPRGDGTPHRAGGGARGPGRSCTRRSLMDLAGKAVLITGGKRIGAVVADELARRGMDVAVDYARSRDDAERSVSERARARPSQRGASRESHAARSMHRRRQRCRRQPLDGSMCSSTWRRSTCSARSTNCDSKTGRRRSKSTCARATLCARAAVPFMRAQGGGRIVSFSDWVARSGRPRYRGYLPYYVAKAGVIALTEALALELAPDNILVNAVAPGPILPPPGSERRRNARRSKSPRRSAAGAARSKSRRPCSRSSNRTTSPARPSRVDGGRHVRVTIEREIRRTQFRRRQRS